MIDNSYHELPEVSQEALNAVSSVVDAVKAGDTKDLKVVLDGLMGLVYAHIDLKTPGGFEKNIIRRGEFDLELRGEEQFNWNSLKGSKYSFNTGTAGERLFFIRDHETQRPILSYPKPDEGSYRFSGPFYEAFVELLGTDKIFLDD